MRPDPLFETFLLSVAFLRQLQRCPLSEWSAAKAVELERATLDVDTQIELLLTPSVFADQFSEVIAAFRRGDN